ncbi:MAG TPA: ATP-binding protein, partial [Thermodesulfobacteriota bacterium]
GVTALSRGELAHRVQVDARNEIGQLADHVNAMAARLEAARDRESRAVAEARAARDRLAFLAGASTQIGASLDYEATLRAVAHLVVPVLADGCLVDLADPDHATRPFAAAHVDPAREALLQALHAGSDEVHGPRPAVAAFHSGKPELVPDVTDVWMESVSQDARQLDLLRRLGLVSCMAVPLVARGRTVGVVTFLSSSRRYGSEDLQLATELAQRAAVAVDNARLFRAAQEAIRQAQGAIRSRDAFLARASHELRTPLTSALGNVRLLRKAVAGSLKEPPDALIAVAVRNLEQMAALIEDLLDASKLAAGQEHLALAPVDLGAVLASSADVVAAQAREKGVTLDIAPGASRPVLGDRLKLEQVFTNLLVNAVKFTPVGGRVQVSACVEGGAAVVRVRDTGEGIDADELERIFEPFYQARRVAADERPRRRRGAGLGLAICRQIVMLHGGRIWAESEGLGRGSVFVVRIPGVNAGERAA